MIPSGILLNFPLRISSVLQEDTDAVFASGCTGVPFGISSRIPQRVPSGIPHFEDSFLLS